MIRAASLFYVQKSVYAYTHTIVDVRSLFLFQWTKKNARDLSLRGPLKYVCNFGLNIYMWKYFQFLLIALNSSDKYCASRRSEICHKHAIKLRVFEWFEPVAVAKCVIILQTLSLSLPLSPPIHIQPYYFACAPAMSQYSMLYLHVLPFAFCIREYYKSKMLK